MVLATGAEQIIEESTHSKYLLKESAEIFSSDEIIKYEGFNELVKQIKKSNGKCNICVVGGSHSAFSVLYLLLRGPCKISTFENF